MQLPSDVPSPLLGSGVALLFERERRNIKMWRCLPLFLILAAIPVHAQISLNPGNRSVCTLRVDVAFVTGGRVISGVRVQLQQGLANAAPI